MVRVAVCLDGIGRRRAEVSLSRQKVAPVDVAVVVGIAFSTVGIERRR